MRGGPEILEEVRVTEDDEDINILENVRGLRPQWRLLGLQEGNMSWLTVNLARNYSIPILASLPGQMDIL